MTTLVYSNKFLKSSSRISSKTKIKLGTLLYTLSKNPFHPTLHTKGLSRKLEGLFSFRIAREWRVIFQFEDTKTIKVLRVINRKDAYK